MQPGQKPRTHSCQKADSKKSTKRNIKYICHSTGLALQLSTQAKTNGSEAQPAADNTSESNAEDQECAVVMDQEPILQAVYLPILDTPQREITSVPAKGLFLMDTNDFMTR